MSGVKIVYQDIAVGADEDAQITAIDSYIHSELGLLPFSRTFPHLTSGEVNHVILSGDYEIYSEQSIPFISDDLTGEDARFTSPPVITIDFDEQYTTLGIYLFFSPGTYEYCTDINIKYYQNGRILQDYDFAPDNPEYYCAGFAEAYDRIVITLKETSLPYQRAKLGGIIFGVERIFDRYSLASTKVVQECNLISETLANNTLDFEISSKENVEYVFQYKQPLFVYNGDNLIGVFYISGNSRKAAGKYSITGVDAIGLMDNDKFPDKYYSNAQITEALDDIFDGNFTYELEEGLKSKTVTGVITGCTRRQALQQVMFAVGAVADTSNSELVRIFQIKKETAADIPAERTRLNGQVKRGDKVTAIEVTAHNYSTIASDNDSLTIDGVTYYDTKQVRRIDNPDITANDKPNVKQITNATLVNNDNLEETAQRVYEHYLKQDTHSMSFRVDKEKVGDYVSSITPWQSAHRGHLQKMTITLSGIAVAASEILGEE